MIAPQPDPIWRRARRRQDRFARAFGRGLRCAAASLDRGCARRPTNARSGRRNGALIEQRNWLLMPCLANHPSLNWPPRGRVRQLVGRLSSQARYSSCRAINVATAAAQRFGRGKGRRGGGRSRRSRARCRAWRWAVVIGRAPNGLQLLGQSRPFEAASDRPTPRLRPRLTQEPTTHITPEPWSNY